MIDADTYDVRDYQTGKALAGLPSTEVVEESLAAGHEGAVLAYYDGEQWQYVPAEMRARREAEGEQVRSVYVVEAAE